MYNDDPDERSTSISKVFLADMMNILCTFGLAPIAIHICPKFAALKLFFHNGIIATPLYVNE